VPSARFVGFRESAEPAALVDAGITFALVVARTPAGIVLVHNRYRGVWELPGGLIDAGESARAAASREFAEEAGCAAGALDWLGIVEVDNGRPRRGAVFGSVLAAMPAPVVNEEIDGLAAWTPDAAPQPLGESDRRLLEVLSLRPAPPGSQRSG